MKVPEITISERLVNVLKPYFEISPEVWSASGKHRIDLIIREKITGATFGVEVKKIDKKRGLDIGLHIQQAIEYSKDEFVGFGKVPIFIVPPISYDWWICPDHENMMVIDGVEYYKDRHDKYFDHHTANGFLCAFNIGEMRKEVTEKTKYKHGGTYFKIIFCNKVVWTNKPKYGTNEPIGLDERWYKQLIEKINGEV